MTHQDKIDWMIQWAHKHKCVLDLEGEVGFGRECVGILRGSNYIDYTWYDSEWNRQDPNGEVWCPTDAYHKHDCVAVLGRGQVAEEQLYDWLKWFDDNGFVVESVPRDLKGMDPIQVMFSGTMHNRMIKRQEETA